MLSASGGAAQEKNDKAAVELPLQEQKERAKLDKRDEGAVTIDADTVLPHAEELARREKLRDEQSPVDSSTASDVPAGQLPGDDFFGEMSVAFDSIAALEGTDPAAFLAAVEMLLSEVGQTGGLDGRNDAANPVGISDSSSTPGTTGVNLLGGLITGPGSAMDETGQEDGGFLNWMKEKLGIGEADEGSGVPGDQVANATAAGMTGAAIVVEGAKNVGPNAGAAGRVAGGVAGMQFGVLTANTSSPDAKADEFFGWATIIAALFDKAPMVGGASMDAETAAIVRDGDDFRQETTEESQGLPSHLNDPSAGWGDVYDDLQWAFATGGGLINPDPMNDTGETSMGDPASMDPTDFVATYPEPVLDREVGKAPSDNRDWEY